MKTYRQENSELIVSSLAELEKIDNVTYYVIGDNVIADEPLPAIKKNQALKVVGERNEDGHYTVSKNVKVVADLRGEKAYNIENGQEVEIQELGELPTNVTLAPRPSEYHTFKSGKWTLTKDGAARKKNDEARAHNQNIYAQIDALELKQNRPIREKELAKETGDEESAKAALDRIKAIDEQIQQLRTTLKTTSKE